MIRGENDTEVTREARVRRMQISPRATPAEVNKRAASARLPFQIAAMANLDKVPPTDLAEGGARLRIPGAGVRDRALAAQFPGDLEVLHHLGENRGDRHGRIRGIDADVQPLGGERRRVVPRRSGVARQ